MGLIKICMEGGGVVNVLRNRKKGLLSRGFSGGGCILVLSREDVGQ